MKTFAKVVELCPVISGTSDNGNDWEKQTVVVETLALEPQVLAIEFMGERKTKMTKPLQKGQQVEVDFVIRSNEYQGRWFTRLDGLRILPMQPAAQPAAQPAQPTPPGVQQSIEMPPAEEDLPF